MKIWAVVRNGEPLQEVEVDTPVPTGAEVLIEVTHCGVCHSDLHFWKGEYNMGHGKVMKITDRGVVLPRAPGHEVVGRVVACGPDAQGTAVGDLRIVYPWIGCGHCERCLAGEDNMCAKQSSIGVVRHGGFGSHVLVPHARYLIEFGALDPAVASTYACSGITVLSAIRKLAIQDPDSPVLLLGAGGLGHSAIAMLNALGHRRILVVDIDAAKRQSALAAGASVALDGLADDLAVQIAQSCAGRVLLYAMDFVNSSKTASTAFGSLAKGGKLILVGAAGGEIEISLATMIFVPRSLVGTQTGSLQDLRDVVALAQSGRLQPIPVERIPARDAYSALMRLQAGKVMGRLVLEH